MSTSKERPILVIAEIDKGVPIHDSPLLSGTGDCAIEPLIDWLFFYRDDMGIITETYRERLFTGYPILSFKKGVPAFHDKVSRQLFISFFPRFLFSRKTRDILLTTPVAADLIAKIATENGQAIHIPDHDRPLPRGQKPSDLISARASESAFVTQYIETLISRYKR